MKNKFIILLFLFAPYLQAQDPIFSQFYAAPMQLNPALTGLVAAPVVMLNYRNQWPNLPQAYNTFAVSYGQYFSKMNSSFGLSLEGDIAGGGIYNSTQIGFFYVYDIRFNNKFYIRIGLEGAAVSKRLNWDKLVFLDQLDLANGITNNTQEMRGAFSKMYFDASTGIVVNTKYFYLGFSAKHLNVPKESFVGKQGQDGSDEIPMALSFHFGSEFQLNRNNKKRIKTFLSPSLLLLKQRKFYQLNVGTYLRSGIFLGGIWFRHTFTNSDAVILMVGVQKGIFKIGYSFDLTISKLGMQTGGTHEISLLFNFENKTINSQKRYNDCLNLFR